MAAHDQKPLFLGFVVSIVGMLTIFATIVLDLGSLRVPAIIGGIVIWAIGQVCIHGPMRQRAGGH